MEITYHEWKEISEKEYEEFEVTLDNISEYILCFNKIPISKEHGLLAYLHPNDKIIGYKYFKGNKTTYIC